jgi:hypothetical protein
MVPARKLRLKFDQRINGLIECLNSAPEPRFEIADAPKHVFESHSSDDQKVGIAFRSFPLSAALSRK